MADLIELQEEIQTFESQQTSLFDQTAENRAKNMTIMWWVLNLAHRKDENNYVPVFGEGDYDSRLEVYDEIEEKSEAFWTEVVKKLAYFTTFWYTNGITSEEEFKQVENMYNSDSGEPEEVSEEELEEEAKAEEAKAEEAKAEEGAVAEEVKAEEEAEKTPEAQNEKSPEQTEQKAGRRKKPRHKSSTRT